MIARGWWFVVLMFVCAVAARAEAQSPMESATAKAASQITTPTAAANALADEAATAMPAQPADIILDDPPTRQRYLEAMQRYYDYRANGYAYRSRVFEWQLLSSRAIFAIVLALVAAGMYFAAVQFRVAMMEARRASHSPAWKNPSNAADAVEAKSTLATQIEVSAKGLVVNSSVLGVIILGLSLAFFYLYLLYVYPIHNVL